MHLGRNDSSPFVYSNKLYGQYSNDHTVETRPKSQQNPALGIIHAESHTLHKTKPKPDPQTYVNSVFMVFLTVLKE